MSDMRSHCTRGPSVVLRRRLGCVSVIDGAARPCVDGCPPLPPPPPQILYLARTAVRATVARHLHTPLHQRYAALTDTLSRLRPDSADARAARALRNALLALLVEDVRADTLAGLPPTALPAVEALVAAHRCAPARCLCMCAHRVDCVYVCVCARACSVCLGIHTVYGFMSAVLPQGQPHHRPTSFVPLRLACPPRPLAQPLPRLTRCAPLPWPTSTLHF